MAFTALPSRFGSLAILLPILPPIDSLVVKRTAQSPVPFGQLLAQIPCPSCAAQIASTIARRALWPDAHCPMRLFGIVAGMLEQPRYALSDVAGALRDDQPKLAQQLKAWQGWGRPCTDGTVRLIRV